MDISIKIDFPKCSEQLVVCPVARGCNNSGWAQIIWAIL